MEYLQTLLDNSEIPIITAFLLGLLTAVSPCPLATNITAIGFISKDINNRNRIFTNGILYTLGRVLAYSTSGAILIAILRKVRICLPYKRDQRMGRTAACSCFDVDRAVYAIR